MLIPYSTDAPIYHYPIATVTLIVINVLFFFAFCIGLSDSSFNNIDHFRDADGNRVEKIEVIRHYLKDKQLRTVLETFEPPPRPISVVYPHARLLPVRSRVFIDWIKHALREFQA